jgi:hypothetical protein
MAAVGVMAQAPASTMPKTVEAERLAVVDEPSKPRAGLVVARDGKIGLRLTDMAVEGD